jgi:hypothetical protein
MGSNLPGPHTNDFLGVILLAGFCALDMGQQSVNVPAQHRTL